MARCELLDTCPFFNDRMTDMPLVAQLFKKLYCLSDNSVCARYLVARTCGRENVPPDLYPNQEAEAQLLIEEHADPPRAPTR